MEAWEQSVAASDRQRLRSRVENSAHNTPVGVAWTPLANWWEVHLSRPEEPQGWER